ncbi:MAG: phosphoribosylglycinamide formyltransferase [Casimicrobiaceae bacterium]
MTKRIAVLVSGRGSNLAALIDAEQRGALGGAVSAVISNKAGAAGLAVAARHGIATEIVDQRKFADRDDFDAALAAAVDASEPDVVVLAGFMRILGPAFVHRYEGRMLNIHPSLLPSYPGLDTHRRVLADGARVHGCTVHFVTADVDHGPIVAQASLDVRDGDDPVSLEARILELEHALLPAAVRAFCEGRVVIEGRRVRVREPSAATELT